MGISAAPPGTRRAADLRARLAIVLACTAAGALWLRLEGPLPVIRMTAPQLESAPHWYTLSAFPVLGMLIADLAALVRARGLDSRTIELGAQIGVLVLLSMARLGLGIPFSGHSMLFTYFLLRRLTVGEPRNGIGRIEVLAALVFLAAISVEKIFSSDDPLTLVTGCLVGAGLAMISRRLVPAPAETPLDRQRQV